MSKKYYWILDGKYYEVSKDTYQKYKKEHDHKRRLQKYEEEVHVFSLDAMAAEEITGHDVLADTTVNVEERALNNLMLETLRCARKKLPEEDQSLLNMLYDEEKTTVEIGEILGITHQAVSKKHAKIIEKLREILKI